MRGTRTGRTRRRRVKRRMRMKGAPLRAISPLICSPSTASFGGLLIWKNRKQTNDSPSKLRSYLRLGNTGPRYMLRVPPSKLWRNLRNKIKCSYRWCGRLKSLASACRETPSWGCTSTPKGLYWHRPCGWLRWLWLATAPPS